MPHAFSSMASRGASTGDSAADQSTARLLQVGKSFEKLEISVPYARWRGYGAEHGYHRGKLTAFSVDDDDAPDGCFTCVFPAKEKADAITLSWEQVLGEAKHKKNMTLKDRDEKQITWN
mmetsp:Transcript_36244/g.95550  ORF Transcript_36244/g.95550 Transcript_36244/m.95550 type:complete len:119 (-) Transcript_36244:230-586(-)|eukprot:CAMPEP_0115848372 /NCGR_PEP_ID=MMETSP0287-20121206/10888_1 /TAXON_ID=412157 /ORGANISM="Chrysochromulina rotalis, Strain UIO044" /LENGTH=118 /DNA_ID=CAMNT_0003302283 /DNA_START=198 /DNA_END=554 /DNA_ORIENTATION=-